MTIKHLRRRLLMTAAAAAALASAGAPRIAHGLTYDAVGTERPLVGWTQSGTGTSSPRPLWVHLAAPRAERTAPVRGDARVFPVRGRHNFGTMVNGFGGGRSHQGQDILAACGLPVVAALGGRVTDVKWEAGAGNYAVVSAADGTSQVYMHLRDPARVRDGEAIHAGERIGSVGQTGDASTCHLHFEMWTAPGWYTGGHAVDPLPALRRWDG